MWSTAQQVLVTPGRSKPGAACRDHSSQVFHSSHNLCNTGVMTGASEENLSIFPISYLDRPLSVSIGMLLMSALYKSYSQRILATHKTN